MLAGNIILVKILFFVFSKAAFTVNVLQYLLKLCRHVIVAVCECPFYNFVPRGVCIFEKAKTTVGNQIVGFN